MHARVSPHKLAKATQAIKAAKLGARKPPRAPNPVLFNPYSLPGAFACTLETGARARALGGGCGGPAAYWTGPSPYQPTCPPAYWGVADHILALRHRTWPTEQLYAATSPCNTQTRRI